MPPSKYGKREYRIPCLKQITEAIKAITSYYKYCTVCGKIMVRKDENNEEWNKKIKCNACQKKEATNFKYCSSCRKKISRKNFEKIKSTIFFARFEQEKPSLLSFSATRLCPECKEKNKHKIKDIEILSEELLNEFYIAFENNNFPNNFDYWEEYSPSISTSESEILKIYYALQNFSNKVFVEKEEYFLSHKKNIVLLIKKFLINNT